MASFVTEGILIAALVLVLTIFPKNRALHNLIGFILMGSSILVLIAASVLPRLKITQHIEISGYSLPHKVGKEKTFFFLFCGITLLITIMLMPTVLSGRPFAMTEYEGGPEIFSLPSWTILPLAVWGPIGLIFLLITWQGVILFNDHLCHYWWWSKHNVFYQDIKRVEVMRRATGKGGHTYIMDVHHAGASRSPIKINLAIIPARDCSVMLNVIQANSPDATLNDLAQQMRQGDFPMA